MLKKRSVPASNGVPDDAEIIQMKS